MQYADLPQFSGVRADPLTHQEVSARCWNGYHQFPDEPMHEHCAGCECRCYCHQPAAPPPEG